MQTLSLAIIPVSANLQGLSMQSVNWFSSALKLSYIYNSRPIYNDRSYDMFRIKTDLGRKCNVISV